MILPTVEHGGVKKMQCLSLVLRSILQFYILTKIRMLILCKFQISFAPIFFLPYLSNLHFVAFIMGKAVSQ